MKKKLQQELIQRATKAKRNAYAPYSKFRVGAAILTEGGEIFEGCNVENSSYGLTSCAERNAIFNAVYKGKRKVLAVAITSDEKEFLTPCGACRQVISEFGDGNTEIILTTVDGKSKAIKLEKIFPTPPSLEKLKNK